MDINDSTTLEDGFLKRLLRINKLPDQQWLYEIKMFTREFVKRYPIIMTAPEFEEWLSNLPFPQWRLNQLQVAFDKNHGRLPPREICRLVKAFGKTEAYDKFKHARLICSRVDRFKVFFGPWVKAIEAIVYDPKYYVESGIQFVKDMTNEEKMQIILNLSGAGKNIYGTDYTSFEAAMTPEIMECIEMELYHHIIGVKEDYKLIHDVLTGTNKIYTRAGNFVKCPGRRMSGEMNTSLGNGFVNMIVALFLISKQGFKVRGVVEGDDGLFVTDALLTEEQYAKLGFDIKIEKHNSVNTAKFCQLIFTEDKQIIRDPIRFYSKFAWTHNYQWAKDLKLQQLIYGKAICAAYETPHCPIIRPIADYVMHNCKGINPIYEEDYSHKQPPVGYILPQYNPTVQTRILFAENFGISIEMQSKLECDINFGNFSHLDEILLLLDDSSRSNGRLSDHLRFTDRYQSILRIG